MYQIGEQVFGNWTIKRRIGAGGFGAVFEIQREDFGETYKAALKVISVPQNKAEIDALVAEGMSAPEIQRYFYSMVEDLVREFAIMAKLKATGNIVSYEDHAVIPHPDGMGWDIQIRMELLTPLLTYAYQHPFARRDVIQLGIDICKALELCQKYNIIHRDIKPDNIFVTETGDFKLGDFGIARTVEKTSMELSKKGTYSYMAPEVYSGTSYGFTVDTYSLGIVLYRLLNRNRTPFLPAPPEPITASKREAAAYRRFSGEPIPAPYYAQGRLAEIILKACAFDPRERYSTPMQMRQELEAILYEHSDAELIYPEGDRIAIVENQYASKTPVADATTRQQTARPMPQPPRLAPQPPRPAPQPQPPRRKTKKKSWAPVVLLVVFALLLAAGSCIFLLNQQGENRMKQYEQLMEEAQEIRVENPEKAMDLYLDAQELCPDEEAAYVSYAYTLYLAGAYEDCIDYVENELALGKNYSLDSQNQLSEILGASYFERNDYAAAASFFRLSTAGGDITVSAMRDYAVSLGRLGDIEAADEVLEDMIRAGASGPVTTYVQAEIAYAMDEFLEAEELFYEAMNTAPDQDLRKRALRSLAEVYRDCTALDKTGQSPVEDPAMKEIDILNASISTGEFYDSTLVEMLAMAWFEAYYADENATGEYLTNSADYFRQVIDMGIQKDYLYRNLYTIYYELEDYSKAAEALNEYEEVFPNDYMPNALRAIMLITIENEKAQDQRDYSTAYDEYRIAGTKLKSDDDQTYYQQVDSLIGQLKDNGWL